MDEILTPGQWAELKARIKRQYPQLSEADLPYHEAVEQDLLSMVAYSLRMTKENNMEIEMSNYRFSHLKHYWQKSRRRHTWQKVK